MSSEENPREKKKMARAQGHCTVCGYKLVQDKLKWGLVWPDGKTGCCVPCLKALRTCIKVKK